MKYLIKSLISSIHTQLNIDQAQNYPILVEIVCDVLTGDGSSYTLKSFWQDDLVNRTGLFFMLQRLSSGFPHEAHGYLKFVRALVGSNTDCFAAEVVTLLDNMTWYTTTVSQSDLEPTQERRSQDDYYYEVSHELSNRTLMIPMHTKAVKSEA